MAEQVTLTLPDDLAKRVRAVATSTQRGVEEVMLEWLDQTSAQFSPQSSPGNSEASLLQKINLGFSTDWWNRYQSLIVDRQSETIGTADLAELVKMSEALETANVQRVEALNELAQLRDCTVEQVIEALEISI